MRAGNEAPGSVEEVPAGNGMHETGARATMTRMQTVAA
jgi:hypothetical protein